MDITVPAGMEITPEDMDRGEVEVLAAFSINEDGTELTLKSIDGIPVEDMEEEEDMEEGEMEEGEAEMEAEGMPTEEETIGDFVRGQLAKRGR
jgi:hypothetical protein